MIHPITVQRGFTLLEVMVAVALLAMLGLAAAITLNSSVRSEQIVGGSIEQLQRLQRAQQWLRRDLEQLVARRGRTEQGDFRDQLLETGGLGDAVLLDFYKSGRRILPGAAPASHLERVRYRLEGGRLLRDSSTQLDSPDAERWYSAELLDELSEVRLRYFYQQQWQTQWPPLQSGGSQTAPVGLPQALEVVLQTERYGAVGQILLLPEAP